MEITNHEVEKSVAETTTEPPKLYAGKYQSVEELEKAYKNSAKVFNENKELQERLKGFEAPETYSLPESLSLPEQEIQGLKNIAKTAGLNQKQFDNTLSAMTEQQQQYQSQLETRKKILGDKLNIIEDYVTKTYPTKLHSTVLNTLIGDKNAVSEALKHREQILNTQVPGLSNQRSSFSDPEDAKEALAKISDEYHKNLTEKNRKRYINLASEVAKARVEK